MRQQLLHLHRPVTLAAAVFAALLAFAAPTQLASAQFADETLVLFEDTSGPFTLRVTQSPPEAVIGSIRVIVEPIDTATGEPVRDAIVRVFGNPVEGGERQYSPALNNPRDPEFYIAQLELIEPGEWVIEVEVEAEQGLTVAFAQTSVRDRVRSGSSVVVGTIMFALISGGFVGGGLWLWYSSKKARARRDAMRKAGQIPRSYG